jgi:hypothetical protein
MRKGRLEQWLSGDQSVGNLIPQNGMSAINSDAFINKKVIHASETRLKLATRSMRSVYALSLYPPLRCIAETGNMEHGISIR